MMAAQSISQFRIGDWVKVLYGAQRVLAQVVEDRGQLGVRQRRLYRIQLLSHGDESDSFEIPEKNLESAARCKDAMHKYLCQGGLVEILRRNLSGRPDQPRAWLVCTSEDAVKYTHVAKRGGTGGAVVPFFALHDEHVFTPRKDEVVGFITTFGFSGAEAEKVVRAVGTAP